MRGFTSLLFLSLITLVVSAKSSTSTKKQSDPRVTPSKLLDASTDTFTRTTTTNREPTKIDIPTTAFSEAKGTFTPGPTQYFAFPDDPEGTIFRKTTTSYDPTSYSKYSIPKKTGRTTEKLVATYIVNGVKTISSKSNMNAWESLYVAYGGAKDPWDIADNQFVAAGVFKREKPVETKKVKRHFGRA